MIGRDLLNWHARQPVSYHDALVQCPERCVGVKPCDDALHKLCSCRVSLAVVNRNGTVDQVNVRFQWGPASCKENIASIAIYQVISRLSEASEIHPSIMRHTAADDVEQLEQLAICSATHSSICSCRERLVNTSLSHMYRNWRRRLESPVSSPSPSGRTLLSELQFCSRPGGAVIVSEGEGAAEQEANFSVGTHLSRKSSALLAPSSVPLSAFVPNLARFSLASIYHIVCYIVVTYPPAG